MKHSMRNVVSALLLISILLCPWLTIADEKPEIYVELGHTGDVKSVVFSPDGKLVLSGSRDKTLKLWDVVSRRQIRTFAGHTSGIASAVISPDGKYVLSGSDDTTLKLWEIATGKEIRTFKGHTAAVKSVAFSPDGKCALSGSVGGNLKLWDILTGREIRTFAGYARHFISAVISPDSQYVLSAGDANTIKLLEMATGKEVRTFSGHKGLIFCVSYSPDGKYALSASADETIKLWDVATGREIRTFGGIFTGHKDSVYSAAFSPDGHYVLSGSADRTLKLWDVASGREIRSFTGHKSHVNSVTYSPDGKYALSGSSDETLKLWDIATGREAGKFAGNAEWISEAVFSPDGKYALLGKYSSPDKALVLWDIAEGRARRTFTGIFSERKTDKTSVTANRDYTAGVASVAFSPDGKHVLSGSYQSLKLWDIMTGKEVRAFKHISWVESVAFSPDGKCALSDSFSSISLWDIASGTEIRTLRGHSNQVASAVFSPNGKYILSGSNDKTAKLWDVATGREIKTFTGHLKEVKSVNFSPDGKYALTGSMDATLKLWDIDKGKELRTFTGHKDYVISVSFSPDGKYALSGSWDNTLKLWNVATGREIRTFAGHFGSVGSVAYSPDGKYALSGGHDGLTILWEIATGREFVRFFNFSDGEWIVITPEGYFNASPNGAKHLNVRIGNTVYGIDQFYAKFYRPELVQLALAGKATPKTVTLAEIASQKPAPTVHIISPASGSSIDKDSITVSLKITDNRGGIGNVMLYLNGSLVANETRAVVIKGKEAANEKMMSFTVPLIEGKNEIRVIAFNKENSMESNPALVSIISRAVLHKPNLYALVVGINEYKNKSILLNYAVPDAKAFAETLKRTGAPLFEKIDIKVLTTPAETTRESITRAFEAFRVKIKPNDLFVFYNSSHGTVDVVDNEEQYFLLTSNVLLLSSRHIGKDAISQKELAKLIGNIPAQKKVVILDTCNAGKGGREIQVALLQQTRGLTDSTAVKLLQRAIGSAVFSASSDTQLALEGYKGHGLFTYVLLEGLKGKADIKKDGYITVLGLADYVEENVLKLSEEVFKRQQTPTIQTGVNFPIGKIR